MRQIVPSGTHIDFIGRRHIAFAVSAVLLIASIGAVFVNGIQLGIDFAWEVDAGLGYAISEALHLSIGWRYIDLGTNEGTIKNAGTNRGSARPKLACEIDEGRDSRYGREQLPYAAEILNRHVPLPN